MLEQGWGYEGAGAGMGVPDFERIANTVQSGLNEVEYSPSVV